MNPDALKRQAAARALELVRPGMALGLGTGSTAKHFVELLGEKVANGLDVVGVPTSEQTAQLARACGVRLTTLEETPLLDLTVDGADELDDALTLVKGGGGALLREKIVACASQRMIVIADGSKRVATLGAFPLPIEVVRFGLAATRGQIVAAAREAGCEGGLSLRTAANGAPFVTDEGHLILDAAFGAIPDPARLATALNAVPGVVETGLFVGLCGGAILATERGLVELGTV